MKTQTTQERERAIERLREMLPVGARVYGQTVYIAASGMRRRVKLYYAPEAGVIQEITGLACRATGTRQEINRWPYGAVFNGCGYSAAGTFATDLAYALHGDSNALAHSEL